MSMVQSDNLPGPGAKRRLRSRHVFLAWTVVSCVGLLVYASAPAGAESALWKLFLIVAAVVFFFEMVGYLVRVVVSRRIRVPELGPVLAPALVVACTVVAWSADLPILVRWLLSEHSFDVSARQVRSGVDPRTFEGHRLGLYRVDDTDHLPRGIHRDASGIWFAIGPAAGDCSNGTGFAQLAGTPPAGRLHHLNGDWYWYCFDSRGEETVLPDRPIGG